MTKLFIGTGAEKNIIEAEGANENAVKTVIHQLPRARMVPNKTKISYLFDLFGNLA